MKQHRNTKQRKLVLDVVERSHEHPTADMVYRAAREKNATISRGTVYRNLNLLVDKGDIVRIATSGASRFDSKILESHDHIICSVCGAIADVPAPSIDSVKGAVIRATGYRVLSKRTVFEGICPDCLNSEDFLFDKQK